MCVSVCVRACSCARVRACVFACGSTPRVIQGHAGPGVCVRGRAHARVRARMPRNENLQRCSEFDVKRQACVGCFVDVVVNKKKIQDNNQNLSYVFTVDEKSGPFHEFLGYSHKSYPMALPSVS